MTRRRRLRFTLFIALTVLGLPAQRDSVSYAQEKVTILLATGIQIGHVREFVAKQLGFFAEEGLDVSLQPAQGSAEQLQFITAGKGTLGSIDMHMVSELRKKGISTTTGGYNNIRYLAEQSKDWKLHEIQVPMNAWPTNALIVTEDEARHKRRMVLGLVRTFAKGHVFVAASPDAALEVAQKLYPELVQEKDKPRLGQILRWTIEDMWTSARSQDKPLGWFDPDAWAGTEQYYKAEGLIEKDRSLKEIIDESFLAEANTFDKERIRAMAQDMTKPRR